MNKKHCAICLSLLLNAAGAIHGQQEWINPFNFPVLLSGNFAELRNDHFHAGIDFKTQNEEGKTVHAVMDGYVSRITISPWGYGNALFINHPNGTTTVYGHLLRFAPSIEDYVKEKQYEQENFAVDLTLDPEQFPLRQGQPVALSGNTGSSAGPHLHFEIRNTATDAVYDPLEYYKDNVKDTRPPRIDGLMVYPLEGRGAVNGSNRKKEFNMAPRKGRPPSIPLIEAWGDIGLAIKAYDFMDGTANFYGVRRLAMAVDGQVVFSSDADFFAPNETRYINSFTDYEEWKQRRSFFMKTFVEPGNRLSFVKHVNRGIIRIDSERPYRVVFRLWDIFDNLTQYSLNIHGRKQDIYAPDTQGEYFHWKSENRFAAKGVRLVIPAGILYDDVYFRYSAEQRPEQVADVHRLHIPSVPLHSWARLSLFLQTDSTVDRQKYGIVRLQDNYAVWVGGEHKDRWIEANIRQFGRYTIMQDVTPPFITPIKPETWTSQRRISFRISDNLSGIQSFRGEIDGQFALFEYDGKIGTVYYRFDTTRLEKGSHLLTFTLTDACGNSSQYKRTFVW